MGTFPPEEISARLGYDKVEEMYAAVGFGDRSVHSVGSAGLLIEREKAPPTEPMAPTSEPVQSTRKAASGLSLLGVDDVLGRRARCCKPIPGDDVVGYISRGRGITIHRRDCPQASHRPDPERWVEIDWGPGRDERFTVDVEVFAHDRPGLLRDVSELLTQSGVDVRAARAEARDRDGSARIRLTLECRSAEQVARVLGRLDRLPDVFAVRRAGA